MQRFKIFYCVQETGQFHFFPEFIPQQSLDKRQNGIRHVLGLDLVNINMYAIIFYQTIPYGLSLGSILLFQILTSAKPRPMTNDIWYFIGRYILSIAMGVQTFIEIFNSIQEIGLDSLFQNLDLGKVLINNKVVSQNLSRSICVQNLIKIFHMVEEIGPVYFFRILTSAKPLPLINGSWQFLGLDLVNINVYAKPHQHVVCSSRVRASFSFSEFGTRYGLHRWEMEFGNPLR